MRKINPNQNTIKYIHLRYANDDGSICNQGGTTIAWRPSDVKEGKLEVAIARCRYDENFNRAIGRQVAAGHLKVYNFYYRDAIEDEEKQYNDLFAFAQRKTAEFEELADAQREAHGATMQ